MFSTPIDFHIMDNKILFKSMGVKLFGYQHFLDKPYVYDCINSIALFKCVFNSELVDFNNEECKSLTFERIH